MSTIARNDTCPCGSGRKAKKCHEDAIGMDAKVAGPLLETRSFIEQCEGYVPPPTGDDGWSLRNFREHGCPFGTLCDRNTNYGGACASPSCGV